MPERNNLLYPVGTLWCLSIQPIIYHFSSSLLYLRL
jgi:hypothetical protein